MNRKYSPEMRERALRMLAETRPSHPTMMSAVRHVAGLLGMSPETLRLWQRRAEVDAGVKPGLTTDAAVEIKRLQKENAELRKANEILGRALLPGPQARSPGLPHLPRLPRRRRPCAVSEAVARRPARARDRSPTRGELRRLRAPEDACADAATRVGDRSRSDRTADAVGRRGGCEAVQESVHDEVRSGRGEAEGSRATPVHRPWPAPTLGG